MFERFRVSAKTVWSVGGFLTAVFLIAGVVIIIYLASMPSGKAGPLISDQALEDKFKDGDAVVIGTVADPGSRAIEDATVILTLHNGDGQVVWRLSRPVDPDGSFRIRARDLPNIPNLYAGVIAAEAPNFLAEKANVSVDIVGLSAPQVTVPRQPASQSDQNPPAAREETTPSSSQGRRTTISPNYVHLRLVSYSPWLTLVVLIPAIFGVIFAVLHLTQFARGMWVTYWYTLGNAALWGLIVAGLVLLYVWGNGLIPLFWPDLFVSSGIIVFAFVGNIIYIAYSLHEKGRGFFDLEEEKRRRLLLTLGGRVLVAPYIALVAYGIFAATFPTLRTGPFAAFFGFFTGLWIKPVLEALNDIGMRLLSAEEQQKVADKMTRADDSEAPLPATSSALALRPEQAFLDAVAAAREEFLKKKGVVGVDAGFKFSADASKTTDKAIVVYVYEKREPEQAADRVPETFKGFRTDVVELPPASRFEECREVAFSLSWEKINRDNEERLSRVEFLAEDNPTEMVGEVFILADPTVFFSPRNGLQVFDPIRAFQTVRNTIGDVVDFVAFIIDPNLGDNFNQGNHDVPVFNDVRGINHSRLPVSSTRERDRFGTSRLLACQVISPVELPLRFRPFLHELAHSWCAYVTFHDPELPGGGPSFDLLVGSQQGQARFHWGEGFDSGRSCMDQERKEWVANGDGTFTQKDVADGEFVYCPLDLYLMGLIPASEVNQLHVLKNRQQVTPGRPVFRATVKTVTVEQIRAVHGARVPATSPKHYQQALVVVSNTRANGRALARVVEQNFRKDYERQFAHATGGLATLSTVIS